MSAELLLREFERLAEAPSAVARFRRFILELAVHGKLVTQDPADGPASELVRRVGPLRARNNNFGVVHVEGYELPGSWLWCRVSDIGRVVGGGTPPSDEPDCFAAAGTAIAWLTPADLGQQKGKRRVTHGRRDLTQRGLDSCGATVMPVGTVLFTSRAPIGYVAIAANEVATNQGFKSVVPSAAVVPDYVAVFFQAFAPQINGMAPGTTFREVSGKIVAGLPFPLPPFAEQSRIIAKVDELMALCDQLEVAQKEREARRDELRAVSLHRLTASDGDAKPSAADVRFFLDTSPKLITKAEHVAGVRQSIIDLAVAGRLAPQQANTMRDWHEAKSSVADVLHSLRYGTSSKCSYEPTDYPVLRIPNLVRGEIRLEDIKYGLLEDHEADELRLEVGDLLIVRSNGSLSLVGRAALVDENSAGFYYAGYLVRARPNQQRVSPRFLALVFRSSGIRSQIEGPIRTTVGLKNINATELKRLRFSLPDLSVQQLIVAKVDELMALCDQLEAALASAQNGRVRLLEALLHDALVVRVPDRWTLACSTPKSGTATTPHSNPQHS